jgi:Glycolipid 2-alpha-mannosyltransferase
MTQSNAIACLTRGYSELSGYLPLIRRNSSIYEVINQNREQQYPLIIWHEGNIPTEHQLYVLAHEWNNDVRFIDISRVFQLPPTIKEQDLAEGWSVGYRLMCRFNSYYIWQYTKAFDYVMRFDEDCILYSAEEDPFEALSEVKGDFAAPVFVGESHRLTNRTLSAFVQKFAAAQGRNIENPYNQIFPYTNCYVTRTAFWRQPEVQQFLEAVAQDPDSIRFRWGDLPVLGLALNMFASPDKVHRLSTVSYWHGSHGKAVVPETPSSP